MVGADFQEMSKGTDNYGIIEGPGRLMKRKAHYEEGGPGH
jgi:hypothetical protein